MPARKISVTTKISEEEMRRLEVIANRENMSISAIMKMCISAIINNEIGLEKGELKLDFNEGCAELDTPFGEKIEKRLDKLREREYPERFIESIKEQILSGLDEQIDMMPKKFNPKRMRSDEWGC